MENIDNIRQLLDAMSEAAIAVAVGKVIYQNAASLELVGEAGGEEFRMLFPLGLPEELEESGVALAAPGRRRLFLRAAAYGGVKVYLLRRAPERWDAPMDPPLLYGLRTQLTNIKMAADRLSEAALESREEETLEVSSMLQHSCSQMTRLLQNAETILELEQGFPPQDAASIMNTAPVDLSALCHAEMEGLSYFMREHRIDMSLDCPQADILVRLTIRQCWVVVGNLLLNSLQHLPDGGSLRLRLRRENGCATLSIDDNGEGVSLEALGRLFGAEKKRTRPGPQTGDGRGGALRRELFGVAASRRRDLGAAEAALERRAERAQRRVLPLYGRDPGGRGLAGFALAGAARVPAGAVGVRRRHETG